MKKKTWIPVIALLLLIPGMLVYGADDTNLLVSSVSEVEAQGAYSFSVDLTGIPETDTGYTLSLTVSPEVTGLTTKESVSVTYNAVQKSYQIASADLVGLSSLNALAYLPADAVSGTTYTVTAVLLSDSGVSISDTLTFTVAPRPVEEETGGESKDETENETANGSTAGASAAAGGGTATPAASASTVSSAATVTYQGSYNNYLSSLAVTDYAFQTDFTKTNDTYFITVANDVSDITVSAVAEDDAAVVAVTGNDDLAVGVNKVLVSVTAENGNLRTYRIYVTRENVA
ncbi:MAG TPA: cadherin-like beta sandwich domain-containing protein [Clostridiales bacterium]|nr:cadherin-like beta sandwich domain-containing protein [Clostridiales bacterium]